MSDETTLEVAGLDKLIKAMKVKPPVARVGILGDRANRSKQDDSKGTGKSIPTNAEIGAVHEFGSISRGIPERSFLRIPIAENLQKRMEASGLLDKNELAKVIKSGSLIDYVRKIAVLAEGIVTDAFDTGGFGKWAPWKNSNYTNNAGQLLVDTTQLRNSITSEVSQ